MLAGPHYLHLHAARIGDIETLADHFDCELGAVGGHEALIMCGWICKLTP